jgi:hypothetical protein
MMLKLFPSRAAKTNAVDGSSATPASVTPAVAAPAGVAPVGASSLSAAPLRVAPAVSSATGVATLAPPKPLAKAKQPETSTKTCPQCGVTENWGLASWCPSCFYYPKLGAAAAATTTPAPETSEAHQPVPDTYLGVLKAMPVWMHGLWIGIVVIFIISVTATLLLPESGPYRYMWTIVQTLLGLIAAGSAHVVVFLATIPHTDRYGPFDIFLKPIEVWKRTINKLPTDTGRLWQAAWGITAAFCALTLIGGIPYGAVFEDGPVIEALRASTGHKAQKKPEMYVPPSQADSFQKSMEKMPGQADFTAPPPVEKPAAPQRKAECVIIGYVKSSHDGFSSILLGSRVNGRLSYVGSISASDLPEAVRAKLRKNLPQLEQSRPAVAVRQKATWLKPDVACRVGYKDLTQAKTFEHAEFDELLTK